MSHSQIQCPTHVHWDTHMRLGRPSSRLPCRQTFRRLLHVVITWLAKSSICSTLGNSAKGARNGLQPGSSPKPEPQVADPEAEPGQQEDTVARVVVQLLEEFDRAVDRFDDDPFVVGAAEALAFDDLAGDAVRTGRGSVPQPGGGSRPAVPSVLVEWTYSQMCGIPPTARPTQTARMYALFIAAVSR